MQHLGSEPQPSVIKRQKYSVVKREQEPPLPRPFPLPANYRAGIAQGLKDGKLYGFKKAKLMSSVADAIFSHKNNPTGEELRHVAQEMAKKWPFLAMANADYVS